jgi:hypothetical protein
MFQYTHTTGDIIAINQLKLIDRNVNNYLFSLIKGLRQGQFGFDTLHRVTEEIKEYRKVLSGDRKFFIDSGGYSIIAGDVSPRDVSKFTECYNTFLERDAPNNCDYIFSLDIPIFLKYPKNNNIKTIYEANFRSISNSVTILEKNPELYNKFIFVWQFKLLKQYNIWKQIYEETLADKNIKNFAIGGLVSLRGITGIKFSPFIGMAFKNLKLIYDKNLDYTSILHILGVYGLHDRVIMSFLHKLFNRYYLKDILCKVQITYDTVNYALSGLYKLKEQIMFVPEADGKYTCGYAHDLINKMHLVVDDKEVLETICRDLNLVVAGKNVEETRMASLLNVITQSTIDKIIDEEIDKNNIIDLFLETSNFNSFKNKITPILMSLEKKYPLIFGNRTKKNLINFQYCFAFHQWWLNGQKEVELEKLMEKFIQLIRFPFDLNN